MNQAVLHLHEAGLDFAVYQNATMTTISLILPSLTLAFTFMCMHAIRREQCMDIFTTGGSPFFGAPLCMTSQVRHGCALRLSVCTHACWIQCQYWQGLQSIFALASSNMVMKQKRV